MSVDPLAMRAPADERERAEGMDRGGHESIASGHDDARKGQGTGGIQDQGKHVSPDVSDLCDGADGSSVQRRGEFRTVSLTSSYVKTPKVPWQELAVRCGLKVIDGKVHS